MYALIADFFRGSGLTPHGFCLAWQPSLLWLVAASNSAIAIAYYSIPLTLLIFARRRVDLAYPWVFRLFAGFILSCGTTHVMTVLTLWVPAYVTEAGICVVTAVLSLITASAIWPLLPRALALPSPAMLRSLNERLTIEIGERDRSAGLLRDSESRSRNIYRRSPAALFVVDTDRVLRDVSDTLLEMLGYSRDEVVGRSIDEFGAERSAKDDEEWRTLLAVGQWREMPRLLRRRDGEMRETLVTARLERDQGGAPLFVVAAVTDVTDRNRAEAALRASEERLRQSQKMEAVGQLTAGIAHDFNNMLTVIKGSLELLQRRICEDRHASRLLDAALNGADRAAKLTNQLLSFSRRQRLAPAALDAVAVVRGMWEVLARTTGERVQLALETPKNSVWPCFADANEFATSVLNLVLNAVAAIEGQGTVTISFAGRVVTDHEAQRFEEPVVAGEYVVIAVADSGAGMTDDVRRHAVEPFFTTKPSGQGTGLGLSQVYGFARQSGGTLRIETQVGVGTRVEILLPRAQAAIAGGDARQDTAPAVIAQHEIVLVVEDEPDLIRIVTQGLEDQNYVVLAAPDGPAALALLRQEPRIALLFSDIILPGAMNGVELALEARRLRPDLPVLFATGHSAQATLDRWGAELDVLQKPYSIAALCRRVAERLAGRPAILPAA